MVKFSILLFLLALGLTGCYDSTSKSSSNVIPPILSTDDYLKSMAFTGDVLNVESRFVSYSKKAGRVSIVDPKLEKEIWSRKAVGYEFAIALPDFSGMSLFALENITVMTQQAAKAFVLTRKYAHVSAAKNVAAYALASMDGTSIEVIRSLGAGLWQHENLSIPWGIIDPSVTEPPEFEPVLLVSSFNSDGTILTAFSPTDGRYAVFSAASASEPLLPTASWCAGDGVGTPVNATFSSLVWDSSRQIYFAGTADGRIFALEATESCSTMDSLPVINLLDPVPVNRLNVYTNGLIGVIQDFSDKMGGLKYITYNGSSFILEPSSYEDICEVPLGSMEINGGYIVVMCTFESVLDRPSELTPAPNRSNVDPRLYLTINTATDEIINRTNIDGIASAGVVVDPQSQTLYRMQEGAFGTLEIINLVTGERRKHVGIYLENIVN